MMTVLSIAQFVIMDSVPVEEIELYRATTFALKVILFIFIVISDINSQFIVTFSSPSSSAKVHLHQ